MGPGVGKVFGKNTPSNANKYSACLLLVLLLALVLAAVWRLGTGRLIVSARGSISSPLGESASQYPHVQVQVSRCQFLRGHLSQCPGLHTMATPSIDATIFVSFFYIFFIFLYPIINTDKSSVLRASRTTKGVSISTTNGEHMKRGIMVL